MSYEIRNFGDKANALAESFRRATESTRALSGTLALLRRPRRRRLRWSEIAEAAIARGRAEREERAEILRAHPRLAEPWCPIQNLRRKARLLGAAP